LPGPVARALLEHRLQSPEIDDRDRRSVETTDQATADQLGAGRRLSASRGKQRKKWR
jgi:hypothetical protein